MQNDGKTRTICTPCNVHKQAKGVVMTEKLPKRIWVSPYAYSPSMPDDGVEFVRADRYAACFSAGCSLHHHLFKLTYALLNRPDIGESEREMADIIDDAQLALDKWNRFLDGEEE